MTCTINKKMLPVKLHYFFFFAGVAPVLPFLTLYARQLGITEVGVSAIYLCLPILAAVARPCVGWLSDCTASHRTVFLSMLLATTAGYLALYFVPPLPPTSDNQLQPASNATTTAATTSVHLTCADNAWLAVRVCDTCAAARGAQLSTTTANVVCRIDCRQSVVGVCGSSNASTSCAQLTQAVLPATVQLARPLQKADCVLWPLLPTSAGRQLDASVCRTDVAVNQPLASCQLQCDDKRLVNVLASAGTSGSDSGALYRGQMQFWLFVMFVVPAWVGTSIIVPLGDAIAFNLLDDPRRYGYERCWGSVSWGLFSLIGGLLVDNYSWTNNGNVDAPASNATTDYTAAFVLLAALMVIDILVCLRVRVPRAAAVEGGDSQEERPQFWRGVGPLLRSPPVLLFLLTCCVVGVLTGVLWTYSFLYIQDLARDWDCTFGWVNLISGLSLFIQCLFGELPLFFYSAWIIGRLGVVYTQSLVLLAFGVRFLLYSIISSPWLILPIELMNGLTFGLFYSNMVVYAGQIAPPGMVATLQGLVGAVFECVGVAIGAGTGGLLYQQIGGAGMYQVYGTLALLTCALYAGLQCCCGGCASVNDTTASAKNSSPSRDQPPIGSELRNIKHIDDDGDEMINDHDHNEDDVAAEVPRETTQIVA